MKLINTREWGSFQIGQLFDVVKGTRLTKANMQPGDIRFIGSSALNNGLTAMINNSGNIHPANTLTVCYNGSVGETFYQDKPFWASDDVNVLYPKFEMNKYIGLFIAPIIKAVSAKYTFVDKWKQEVMAASMILLPVSNDGKPDFLFMDSYMKKLTEETEKILAQLKQVNKTKNAVDVEKWKEFKISDLFDIHPTKAYKLTNNQLLNADGISPVVVNSGFNNGVGGHTNLACTERAGIITFTDTAAKSAESFFYQEKDFVGYPHVQGMYPKNHILTKNQGMYLTTVLRSSVGKYDFISKMTRDDILNLVVKLPVTSKGTPDWDYMDSYMGNLLNDVSNSLKAFTIITN